MYSHGVNVNIRYCVVLNSQHKNYINCVSNEQCVYSHGVNVNIRYCVVLNSVCIQGGTVLMST